MQLASITILATLTTLVAADWQLYFIDCGSGQGGGNGEGNPEIPPFEVAAQIETACKKGVNQVFPCVQGSLLTASKCDVTGTVGQNSFSSGDPCNCGETLNHRGNFMSTTLGRVAHCNQVEATTSSCSFGALDGITCAATRDWNCYSSYC